MILDSFGKIIQDQTSLPGNVTIDLAARYAAAFGMQALGKEIAKVFIDKTDKKDYNFKMFPVSPDDLEYVQFQIPGLEVLTFNTILHRDNGDNIFAPPLLMSFGQEKTLIETEVNDDDAIVVERWGTRPWDIIINGILIDLDNRIYPSDEIRRLNQNWKYNGVVKVVGPQFEEKDIDSIFFRNISFSVIEGFQDTIQFTINASSIKGVNFTLLKPTKPKYRVEVGQLTELGFNV